MLDDVVIDTAESSNEFNSPQQEFATLWRNRGISGIELFRGDFLKYSFTRHFHSVAAFGAVESGSMRSWHRDGDHTVGPGMVMMFNPGDVHAPFPANDQRWSFRMFYLHDGLFQRLNQGVSDTPIRFKSPFSCDPLLARKILSLHRQLQGRCEPVEFDCRILEIFEHLASRHTVHREAPMIQPPPENVSRMREYIHAHVEDAISLEVLAGVANLSPYHALRSFRGALGLPPHKYLLQVRVERAKELLQSGRSIADVAATLGFADQSHLTRKFKRVFGVPPGQSLRSVT